MNTTEKKIQQMNVEELVDELMERFSAIHQQLNIIEIQIVLVAKSRKSCVRVLSVCRSEIFLAYLRKLLNVSKVFQCPRKRLHSFRLLWNTG